MTARRVIGAGNDAANSFRRDMKIGNQRLGRGVAGHDQPSQKREQTPLDIRKRGVVSDTQASLQGHRMMNQSNRTAGRDHLVHIQERGKRQPIDHQLRIGRQVAPRGAS